MFDTKTHSPPDNFGIKARLLPELVGKNRLLLYAIALLFTLIGAYFGSDGKHPLLSAFIAGLGAGLAFATARLSRR